MWSEGEATPQGPGAPGYPRSAPGDETESKSFQAKQTLTPGNSSSPKTQGTHASENVCLSFRQNAFEAFHALI